MGILIYKTCKSVLLPALYEVHFDYILGIYYISGTEIWS